MILVVTLTVRKAAFDQFREFEQQAARVMAKHGGAIERTVFVAAKPGEDFFQEVHLVTFPNQAALTAYQQDAEIKTFVYLREAAVIKTEILVGEAGPNYGGTSS